MKKRDNIDNKSNLRYQYLLVYNPSVLFSFKPQKNLVINYISDNIKERLGYEPIKFIDDPQSWADCVHPEDLPDFLSQLPELLEKGFIVSEYRFKHIDGTYRWLHDEKRVYYDTNNQPLEIIGSWIDITERKKMEQELRESEKKYKNERDNLINVLNSMEDGVYIVNQQYDIEYANPSMKKNFGPIGGKKCYEYTHERLEPCPWCKIQDVLKGKFVRSEIYYDKNQKTYDVMDTPLRKSDSTISKLRIFRDITELKYFIQKLKESEEKHREAYEIANFYKDLFAHDINNILSNILASSELGTIYMNTSKSLDKIKELLSIISDQVKTGASLISNVRKLSELKKSEIPTQSTEVCELLKKSIISAKKAFQDRDINIQVNSIDEMIFVQANILLEDVFGNIFNNAMKYNDNPSVDILVRISKEQKEGKNYLKFEFVDNGIGVADDRKKIIFKRGYKKDKGGKGMGFGLSLVKKIIESYNGQIWVEDRVPGDPSKGSNFIVLIPKI